LSDRSFEALAQSGAVSKADVAAARELRAGRPAKRHVVDIRKRDEVEMETPVQKVERARRVGATLQGTIDAYAAKHGVSKSVAADMVLLSPTLSEYHRLDKALAKPVCAALIRLRHCVRRSWIGWRLQT
jgi:hypothetical protein